MQSMLHCSLLLLLSLLPIAARAQSDRPNILFAFADDWGQYASLYSDPDRPSVNDVIHTANIDRIAQEGVSLPNAFVSSPSCTPSRAAVSTGMHFFRCGSQSSLQSPKWPSEQPNPVDQWPGFGEMLGKAGYHVGQVLKTGPKLGPPSTRYNAGPSVRNFSRVLQQADEPEVAKREALEQIRRAFRKYLADRPAGAPLLFWFGPTNIHRKWERGSGQRFWGIDPDQLKGKLPKFLPDVATVREDFADCLGEVLAWDAMIGVLLEELDRIGELDNTLVVLSGDNGMPGMPRGKTNLYDFGSRTPLLVRWPRRVPSNRVVTDFVGLVDLAPTFLEAAGIEPPNHMQGRSLMPVLTAQGSGRIDPQRDAVLIGRERHVLWGRPRGLPYPARAIRGERFLYIRNFAPDRWPMCSPEGLDDPQKVPPTFEQLANNTSLAYADVDASPTKAWMIHHRSDADVSGLFALGFDKRPAEELYDLRTDPDQLHNVADDPDYARDKAALQRRLMQWLRAAGDPRVINGGTAFDYPPYSEPGLSRPATSEQ